MQGKKMFCIFTIFLLCFLVKYNQKKNKVVTRILHKFSLKIKTVSVQFLNEKKCLQLITNFLQTALREIDHATFRKVLRITFVKLQRH